MRKALGALAFAAAMWAGTAQAAFVYFVEIEGIFESPTIYGAQADELPETPLAFSIKLGFESGVERPSLAQRTYFGKVLDLTINGAAYSLAGLNVAEYQMSFGYPDGKIRSSIHGVNQLFPRVTDFGVIVATADDEVILPGDPYDLERLYFVYALSSPDGTSQSVMTSQQGQLTAFRTYGEEPPFEVAPIPEPATWTMMIAGFGLVGSALRRRPTACSAAR